MKTMQFTEDLLLYRIASGRWNIQDARKHLYRDDFKEPSHHEIFDSLIAISNRGEAINPESFIRELIERESLEALGGAETVKELIFVSESIDLEDELQSLKSKSAIRKISELANGKDPRAAIENIKRVVEKCAPSSTTKISFLPMTKRLSSLDEKLEHFRGKQYLGLCQTTLEQIDDKFLGLRKLILLAAAPNAGKTALTIQLALDVLKTHQEACLVYFSLEMQESDIFIRMFCNLAKMDYRTFVLGSDTKNRALDPSAYFTADEFNAIRTAREGLGQIGDRLQIVDSARVPSLDAHKAISLINEVKERTKTSRVIVVIDYLQVWPLPQDQKFHNELEIDKWRIGEVKKIRDAINDDPVIVISEARKPSNADSAWGGDMSDVMGSARATYTPDSVLLFSQVDFKDLAELWDNDGKPVRRKKNSAGSSGRKDEDIDGLCDYLESKEISLCRLHMPKGRDGMRRFSTLLEFHYGKNVFKTANFAKIKASFINHQKGQR